VHQLRDSLRFKKNYEILACENVLKFYTWENKKLVCKHTFLCRRKTWAYEHQILFNYSTNWRLVCETYRNLIKLVKCPKWVRGKIILIWKDVIHDKAENIIIIFNQNLTSKIKLSNRGRSKLVEEILNQRIFAFMMALEFIVSRECPC